MLVAVGSVKGSPGATTLALTMAAVWPPEVDRVVMVEADCAGGDVGGRCWLPDDPGLASLATAARAGTVALEDHAVVLPCGAAVVVAPAERQPSTVAVGLLAQAGTERWAKGRPAILDLGRLDPGTPAAELAASAEVLMVCTRGDEASLSRLVTAGLSADAACVVLVGGSEYSPREIQDAVGVPVAGDLPWDPKGARVVWGRGRPGTGWSRRGMPAVARHLAGQLSRHLAAHPHAVSDAGQGTVPSARGHGVQAWVRTGDRKDQP